MQLPLPIASYRLPSPAASSSLLVNCYAQPAPKDSPKGRVILRRSPGIRDWCEVAGLVSVRGAIRKGDTLFALIGTTLYSIDQNGAETAMTGSVPGSERVRMATNGTTIFIVRPTDNTGYVLSGTTVSQETDPTFTGWGAADVDFLDTFYVFRRPNSNQVFNSGQNAITFNALDFTSFDAAPGNLNGLIVDNREIFGTKPERGSELWYNAARSPGSPFARSPQGFREIGSAASYSLGRQDNSIFWLANDKTFRRLAGASEKVSQPGIEAVLERLTRLDDCFSLPYTIEGHLQIAFTFPFANRTVVYDCTTDQWHDRESLGLGRWRASCVVQCYGHTLIGDSQSGKIGILDPDTHEEFGDPQRVEWTYQPVYAENRRVSHQHFELVLNVGSGVTSGQGQNPLATLKISDDGGNVFRSLPTRSLGPIGKYKTTVDWWKLGSAKQRVYRVEITDPVPLYIADTQLLATGAIPFQRGAYG